MNVAIVPALNGVGWRWSLIVGHAVEANGLRSTFAAALDDAHRASARWARQQGLTA